MIPVYQEYLGENYVPTVNLQPPNAKAPPVIHMYGSAELLYNTATVCAKLSEQADIEKKRRIQKLPVVFQTHPSLLLETPTTCLLVYDEKLEKSLRRRHSFPDGVHEDLLSSFKGESDSTLVMKVDEMCHCAPEDDTINYPGSPNILGLFLPSLGYQVRVHVAWFREPIADWLSLADRLDRQLGLTDPHAYTRSTLLVMGVRTAKDRRVVSELGYRAWLNGHQLTLACLVGTQLVTASRGEPSGKPGDNWQSAMAMRISGAGVQSSSTFVHYFADKREIERKLRELKGRVQLGRFNVGLVAGPKCRVPNCKHADHPVGDSQEVVSCVRRVFPDLEFNGLFTYSEHYLAADMLKHFSEDEHDKDNYFNPRFVRDLNNYLSIVIMSYL